ncbi:hypothetical protein ABZ362_33165 [Streptomyces sp. NPDC005951]|uniref:hypothetical protein n=1 Tax=Streptomyces sp. NPDC005951 TaxID=3154573 RepID=UPI0033C1DC30
MHGVRYVADAEPAPDRARVEWSGTFTPDGSGDDEAAVLFHGIHADGLAALTQSLAG